MAIPCFSLLCFHITDPSSLLSSDARCSLPLMLAFLDVSPMFENNKMNTYIRETSRNAYTRGKEHLSSLDIRDDGSVMWKHSKEKHDSHIPNFCMSFTGQFRNDAMLRQISEAVRINREDKSNVMSTKNEWNYVTVLQVTIE